MNYLSESWLKSPARFVSPPNRRRLCRAFRFAFKIKSLSACRFLSISCTCAASFFKSSALALPFAAGWFNLSLKSADLFFQRLDAFGLRGLRVDQVLYLAVELVNLLLRRGVLRARDAKP